MTPLTLIPWSPFQLDSFARHEDAVRIATSLFGLVAQDFRIDKVGFVITLSYHCLTIVLKHVLGRFKELHIDRLSGQSQEFDC